MLKALITGITMGLYLAISVGPILFTVIKHRLDNGIRGGFSFVAGIWLSDILFVLASNVFTVFTTQFAYAYIRQIGYGGGLLLLVLGMYYLFFKKGTITTSGTGIAQTITPGTMAKIFASGFLINTLNPILFFEWLSAATIFATTYSINNRIIIFTSCLAVNIFADVLKITLAGKIKEKLQLQHINVINRGTGVVLAFCGCFLLYQTFFHADKWLKHAGVVAQTATA